MPSVKINNLKSIYISTDSLTRRMKSLFNELQCHETGKVFSKYELNSYNPDNHQPLVASYSKASIDKEDLIHRRHDMWRYAEMLPVLDPKHICSLGEGMTPLIVADRLTKKLGVEKVLIKDEGQNPTGSFKARGLAMAVSKAKELGIKAMCIPTAGNAGSALSAYCALAGIEAHVFMPKQTPRVFQMDCEVMGANVTMVDGNISDCAALMREMNTDGQWFDVTTLKEPYRLEGKKTMGYEIAEQLNWTLPNVVMYPTGGGTGLIGIWKAFMELKTLGWIEDIDVKMVAVQIAGCNPIVEAFHKQENESLPFQNPGITIANGLRVPHAFGHKLILKTLYESHGTAIDVTEQDMKNGISEIAKQEGLFVSPEGAAVWEAAKKLKQSNFIKESDSVVLLNTGSAYKYVENLG